MQQALNRAGIASQKDNANGKGTSVFAAKDVSHKFRASS